MYLVSNPEKKIHQKSEKMEENKSSEEESKLEIFLHSIYFI